MTNLTLMFRLIETLSLNSYPIVFKGALVLNTLLVSQNPPQTSFRMTKDIDADWVDVNVSMGELTNYITVAVSRLGVTGLTVVPTRSFGNNKSAGFDVYLADEKLFSLDVSPRKNICYSTYRTPNNVPFYGASKEKIFFDKLLVLSTKTIFRRIKDIYDLYMLSALDGYRLENIIKVKMYLNKELGNFEEFLYRVEDINHAYTKMRGIAVKPDFTLLHGRVRDFCFPFITNTICEDGIWLPEQGVWHPTFK